MIGLLTLHEDDNYKDLWIHSLFSKPYNKTLNACV